MIMRNIVYVLRIVSFQSNYFISSIIGSFKTKIDSKGNVTRVLFE